MPHVAKRTTTRAFVPHDHERRRAFAKTLADIRARGLFAYGEQFMFAQNFFNLAKARGRRCRLHANPLGLFQGFAVLNLDRNARYFIKRFLLFGRVVCGIFL